MAILEVDIMIRSRCSQHLASRWNQSFHQLSSSTGARESLSLGRCLPSDNNNRIRSAPVFHAQHHLQIPSEVEQNKKSATHHFSKRCFHSSPALYGGEKKSKKKKQKKQQNQSNDNSKGKNKKKSMKEIIQPKNFMPHLPDPLKQMQKEEKKQQEEAPRPFLASTGSNYAYISRCAVMDEINGEVYIDPKSLFSELSDNATKLGKGGKGGNNKKQQRQHLIPNVFRKSHFEYFPPSAFPNHEPPQDGTPEVAFLGRSNTGKSSLINALSGLIHRAGGVSSQSVASGGGELARTSKRPGRTQTINYFGLVSNEAAATASSKKKGNIYSPSKLDANQSKIYLVDLPGFGFAAAPNQDVDEWQKKTQEFLISRVSTVQDGVKSKHFGQRARAPPLKRLYLLIDSRLSEPPLLDLTVMGWCDDYDIPYSIVLTKVDRTSRANCVKLTNQMCMRYHSLYNDATNTQVEEDEELGGGDVLMDPVIYWTSARDGLGMEELLLSVENNMFSEAGVEGDESMMDAGEEEEEEDYNEYDSDNIFLGEGEYDDEVEEGDYNDDDDEEHDDYESDEEEDLPLGEKNAKLSKVS